MCSERRSGCVLRAKAAVKWLLTAEPSPTSVRAGPKRGRMPSGIETQLMVLGGQKKAPGELEWDTRFSGTEQQAATVRCRQQMWGTVGSRILPF